MKRALIVGINYEGTGNDLRGCLNDAYNMEAMLKGKGFNEIRLVLEKDATTAGIISALDWLVTGAASGDVIVFHYSGHGSQLPSEHEPDGFEEIICPYDLNWRDKVITDDTLRAVFNKVPRGANTTVILDCCHSGTALDQVESLQITRGLLTEVEQGSEGRFLRPPAEVVAELQNRQLVNWSASRDVNASALLIAGCQANQTSADAFIDGTFQGAATYSLLKEVAADSEITYRTLVTNMNKFMDARGFTQNPQLDGFSNLYDKKFLEPFGEVAIVAPVVQTAPPQAPPKPEKDTSMGVIFGIVAMVLGFAVFISLQ